MPLRPRKVVRRTKATGLTEMEIQDLVTGYCFFDEPFRNDEERRKCWKKNRAEILALQGKPIEGEASGVYFDFFTRPHAWWRFNAPVPRLFVKCSNDFCRYFSECPVPKNIPTETPDCLISEDVFRTECVSHNFRVYTPERETEKEFLKRNNLLTEEEKKQCLGQRI